MFSIIHFQSRIKIYIYLRNFLKFLWNFIKSYFVKLDENTVLIEKKLSKSYKAKYTSMVGQCREGIYLSVKYSIERKGANEVLLSPFTLFNVVNMVIKAGGKPVFVDLEQNSLAINKKKLIDKMDKMTACIILTHLNGIDNNILEIENECKKNQIFLINDLAVAFGSKYNNNLKIYGDIGVVSFQAMKNIQCFMGGALIHSSDDFFLWFNNQNVYKSELSKYFLLKKIFFIFLVVSLTKFKIINIIFFQIIKYGYRNNVDNILNYIRPDNNPSNLINLPNYYFKKITKMQINYLLQNFKHFEIDQSKRLNNAQIYKKEIENILEVHSLVNKNFDQTNHLDFPIKCKDRDKLFDYLLKKNVDVRKFYYRNCADLDIFKNFSVNCTNAKNMEESILVLPCYSDYKKNNIFKNINYIKKFYKKKK